MNLTRLRWKLALPEEVEKINSTEAIKKTNRSKVVIGPPELCQNQKYC